MITAEDHEGTTVLHLDDGKVNAFSLDLIAELDECLDRSVATSGPIVLGGRDGILSAGLDLQELNRDPATRRRLATSFVTLTARMFELERPMVVACTGHALGAGAALLCVADRRIGASGPFKIGFNETAAGVSMSAASVELVRYRMPMPWFESIVTGTLFEPPTARTAGLLDQVVEREAVMETALAEAARLQGLSAKALAGTKRLARKDAAARIRAALDDMISQNR
jgi:enoyl-CoA hydratase